jgi:hypothetical protein
MIWLNGGLPVLENFKIKYETEGFEEKNNFLHRNFFIFKFKGEGFEFIFLEWFVSRK